MAQGFCPQSHPMSVWGRLTRDVMDGLEVHLGGSVSETQRMAAELERTYGHRPQLDAPAPKPISAEPPRRPYR
jgi:hypothetical protein